ncbi:MAG: copper transporter, partial [Desulfitobacteriaceae bacterium]|nr:copper transporter [Desulfitobacteriaceae bacterium]
MVDYKYHVITLVAIFLALGIGILIGSMMLGGDFVVEQQKNLIDRLENDFRQMRVQTSLVKNDLAAAKENIKNYQDFWQEMLPILAKDRLKGLRVAVIQTGNSFPIDDIDSLLRLAGTEVKSVTTILEDFTIA